MISSLTSFFGLKLLGLNCGCSDFPLFWFGFLLFCCCLFVCFSVGGGWGFFAFLMSFSEIGQRKTRL